MGGGGGKGRRVEVDLLRIYMGITGFKIGSPLKECVQGAEHSSHYGATHPLNVIK